MPAPLDTRLRGYDGGFANIPKGSSEVKRVLHNLGMLRGFWFAVRDVRTSR